jgi:hypothetical protein
MLIFFILVDLMYMELLHKGMKRNGRGYSVTVCVFPLYVTIF